MLAFRDRTEVLNAGEMIVVPRGMEHKPSAEGECHLLVIDAEGTVNTGEIKDPALTHDALERI